MTDKYQRSDLRIVVVDDSDFSRNLIAQMLEAAGFRIAGEASNATMAMKVIKEAEPHVVITDIVMPEISGIELTEQISKSFDNIAVIVISSLSQEHVILEAIGAGASDFIPKPVQKEQMIDSLLKALNQLNES